MGCGFEPDFEDAPDVLNCADDACYKAKHGGRNQVFMYPKATAQRNHGYTSMLSSINEALEQDGFRLFYQPIVDLSKDEPGQRYELLLRMRREGQRYLRRHFTDCSALQPHAHD